MKSMASEMFIFARFHAKEGQQHSVAAAIQEVLEPTLIDHPLEVIRTRPI